MSLPACRVKLRHKEGAADVGGNGGGARQRRAAQQNIAGMYITGFWTHYLLSNASVTGKTLLTNITRELAPEMRNSLP